MDTATKLIKLFSLLIAVTLIFGCGAPKSDDDESTRGESDFSSDYSDPYGSYNPTYPTTPTQPVSKAAAVANILQTSCTSCHTGFSYNFLISSGFVKPGNPMNSPLCTSVAQGRMPKNGTRLTNAQIDTICYWIQEGAPAN